MGNIKRILLPFTLLILMWSCNEIVCEDFKDAKSSLKLKSLEKLDNYPIDNFKEGIIKKEEKSPIENTKKQNEEEDQKNSEKNDMNKLEDKKNLNIPKKLKFIENNAANSYEQDAKEENKVKNFKENIEVERSIVEEIVPKEEKIIEKIKKETEKEVKKENLNLNKEKLEKSMMNNGKDNSSENDYNDLIINKIYEKENKNNKSKGPNLYFLQILSISSSIFMQLLLFPTIYKVLKKKSTGELDSLPYVILFHSSFLWLIYGILINNSAIAFPNLVGMLLGILYSIAYHKNCKNMWLKQKLYSYCKICGFVSFLLYALIYILNYEQYESFVGFIASVSSIINYGAPLSYIHVVIKKKNSSMIPLEMTIGNFICSFLWLTYGFILKDSFLIIPNLCGFLLSLIQVILIVLYYNKEPLNYSDNEFIYNDGKSKFSPDNIFFNDYTLEDEQKISEVSENNRESFFDFSYDETSPLTGNINSGYNQKNIQPKIYLNHSDSREQSTLNF